MFTFPTHLFQEVEDDIVALVAKAKNGLTLAVHEVNAAVVWVCSNTPQISKDLTTAESLIVATGVANDPRVTEAINAANTAMIGLNAFSASAKSGVMTPLAVIQGYQAVKAAQAAAATAASVAAAAPTPKAA